MEKWEEFLNLWKRYTGFFCAENDKQKELMFWLIMSQLLKCNYLEGGRKKEIREHVFLVQPTRTGKGMLLKSAMHMFEFFKRMGGKGFESKYFVNEVNPQVLAGGHEDRLIGMKKKRVFIPGILKTHCYISWGEGSSLVKPKEKWGDIKNLVLNALDENTPITLTARKDMTEDGVMPTFYTQASFATGTSYLKEMSTNFQASGLLQRFLVSYQTFTPIDYNNLRKKITLMGYSEEGKEHPETNILQDSFEVRKEFYDAFPKDPKGKNAYKSVIGFEKNSLLEYFGLKKKSLLKYTAFTDGQKGEAMQGSITASFTHDKKISAMMASLDGRDTVTLEDLKNAMYFTDYSMKSMMELIDRESSQLKSSGFVDRTELICSILSKTGVIQRNNLLAKLGMLKKRGREWDLAESRTEEFLDRLVLKRIIHSKGGGSGNPKFYFLSDRHKELEMM